MTKFNIGDRVRVIDICGGAHFNIGDELTVAYAETFSGGRTLVSDKADGRGAMFAERFELVRAKAIAPKAKRTAEFKKGGRCDQLLKFLTTGRTITQGEAIVLGFGTRLAATVHDLRGAGHNVVTSMKEDCHGNPYAEYRLVTRKANGDRKAA